MAHEENAPLNITPGVHQIQHGLYEIRVFPYWF